MSEYLSNSFVLLRFVGKKSSFKLYYIHFIKSSGSIGRAQYMGNGNGPLLPIELLLHHRGRDEVVRDF